MEIVCLVDFELYGYLLIATGLC
jgi:hypothetical protein